jgi:peptidoglycan/LPS O-acetylase OafA/YrhL
MLAASSSPSRSLADVRGLQTSNHLDLVRGVAALAVLVCHTRAVLFGAFAEPNAASWSRLLLDFSGSFGHAAVMIFFVLSGFFIAGSVIRDERLGRWSWRNYLVNRLARLYVVLLPGLLLTLAWDLGGLALIGDRPLPSDSAGGMVTSAAATRDRLTLPTLAGNVFFLQEVAVPTFGSNGSLWSLTNEWWYYVMFPCLWLACRGAGSWPARAGYLALAAGVAWLIGAEIASYFAIWLLGAALCVAPRCRWLDDNRWGRVAYWLSAAALAAALVVMGLRWVPAGRLRDGSLGLVFAIYLYCLLHRGAADRGGVYAWVARTLAGFSYTLYVVHFPVLAFCRACFTLDAPWPLDALHLCFATAIMMAIVAYAYGISLFTEARTDIVRRWFMRRPAAAPLPLASDVEQPAPATG